MGIFKLNKEVSESSEDIDADDIINVKNGLKNLGYYKTPEHGMTKFGDSSMFEGMRNFQKDHKLTVDGVMKPQGETENMFHKMMKKQTDIQPQTPSQQSFRNEMEFRRKNLLNDSFSTATDNKNHNHNLDNIKHPIRRLFNSAKKELENTNNVKGNEILSDYLQVRKMSSTKSPFETGNKIIDKTIIPKIPFIGLPAKVINGTYHIGEEVSNIENTFRERYYKQLKK